MMNMNQEAAFGNGAISPIPDILMIDSLQESTILNLLPAAVYVCDKWGSILKYNEQAIKLWGRQPSIGENGERFNGAFKLYHPDGTPWPHEQAPAAACLQDGQVRKEVEAIMERPDGSRLFVKMNIAPINDSSGQLIGVINCFYDTTEQKKAEKALEQKTRELQDYIDNALIGLHWVNGEGIIEWANKAELDMLGYTEEEYIGHHIAEFHVDGKKIAEILQRLSCNETLSQYESELRCKDGSVKTVHIHSNVLWEEGRFVHTRCFTVDVTEQKKLFNALQESEAKYKSLASSLEKKVDEKLADLRHKNEELKKSEERYHKMIDEVEDYAIILLDKDGIIQNWNRGAEKIKGYKESEIVGKSFSTFYLPEDRKKELPKKLIEEAVQNGKADYEGWRLRKDGSTFWGSIVLTALHDNDHNIIGFSKVTRDLTKRKLAEDKLREYTSQLKFQNEQLEQFAYAASHDMKEPLRKILFYNNHLWENTVDKLEEKEREYLNRSMNAAKRMQVLIDDLLAYSKASSETEDFTPVNLHHLVEEILAANKDVIEEKQAVIHVSPLPIVNGIAFQLRQMFDNLIANALKYQHPERKPEVQIYAEKTTGKGINGLDRRKEYYKIVVTDNGIGFDSEYSEKIFELFQRLSGAIKHSGTGVGLALCKKIAQNHHGDILASGSLNEGASFSIYLPA